MCLNVKRNNQKSKEKKVLYTQEEKDSYEQYYEPVRLEGNLELKAIRETRSSITFVRSGIISQFNWAKRSVKLTCAFGELCKIPLMYVNMKCCGLEYSCINVSD